MENVRTKDFENIFPEDDKTLLPLLKKAKNQEDQVSMERLLNQLKPLVRIVTRRYYLSMGGDHEDIFQEGMIAVYKAIRDYDFDKADSFYHFLCMVIKRKMIDYIKTQNRIKQQFLNKAVSMDALIPIDSILKNTQLTFKDLYYEPIDHSIYSDPAFYSVQQLTQQTLISSLIQKLTDLEKKVFYYYFVMNCSYQEIMELTHSHRKRVDNAISRIRKKALQLKDLYNEYKEAI